MYLIAHEHLKLADKLCFSAYNVSRLFAKFYENALVKFDLTFTQYLVLSILWDSEDAQTLHSIGQKLDLASNTLTPLLKRLEEAGWVTRRRLDTDKRQLGIYLTEKANNEHEAITDEIGKCVSRNIDVSEYKAAKHVLEVLESGLKEMMEESTEQPNKG